MKPPRIPPPFPDDRDVTVVDDADVKEWGEDALTPVSRICPDCVDEQIVLANFVPVPANEREAWGIQRCCGTKDQSIWHWCFKFGEVTEPSRGVRTCYDRRKKKR